MSDITPEVFYAILRTDFISFAMAFFELLNAGATLQKNWHHEAIAYQLERVLLGRSTRLIVNIQPRSLKSFLVSVAWPAFVLGRFPNKKFICVSYAQDIAEMLHRDFLRIMESSLYKTLFPNVLPIKKTESEYHTSANGRRYATSIDGTMTGRGADIIIVDDPLKTSDAYSKPARDKVNGWIGGTATSRFDDPRTGAFVVVSQRLHQDDLTGHLLEQGGWELLKLPAVAPEAMTLPLSDTHSFHWQAATPLHDRASLQVLAHIKLQIGTEGYNAQYLQEPVPENGELIKRDYLQNVDSTPPLQRSHKIVQSWDTAMKTSTANDYSVCLTFQVVDNNKYYLLDIYRDRVPFPPLVEHVISQAVKFKANAILIEDQVNGTSLIQTVNDRGLQGVIGRRPSSNKYARMQGQTWGLQAKSLFVPKHIAGRDDFIAECIAFPGRHDDQVDALSQFLEWIAEQQRSIHFSVDWMRDDQDSVPTIEEAFSRFGRH